MDRRRFTRHKRYFPLRFGDGVAEFDAQTRDVSTGGLFVATRDVQPAGARLWLELVVEPQRALFFEGIVVRQLEGLPARRREAGFAVRFLTAAETLKHYLPETPPADAAPISLSFPTAESLRQASDRGLLGGAAFTWSSRELPPGTRVTVTLDAPFASSAVSLDATVVQAVEDARRFGLALAFDEVHRVAAFIGDALEGRL